MGSSIKVEAISSPALSVDVNGEGAGTARPRVHDAHPPEAEVRHIPHVVARGRNGLRAIGYVRPRAEPGYCRRGIASALASLVARRLELETPVRRSRKCELDRYEREVFAPKWWAC